MRILLQRVNHASVRVGDALVGEIGRGLLLLVGFRRGDSAALLPVMAEKITHLRVFPDEQGRFHHSVGEVRGSLLLVPQFTLYGECSKGRRPDFGGALPGAEAAPLFEQFVEVMRARGHPVATGRFGAHMEVALENDGPVTLMIEV